VAVIRDVAMHLHWSPTPLNVPTLSQISILPNGSVQIDGGRPNPAGPVVGLATLMEQLLDSTGCPQQLLDVQKQARANPPVFASPQALHAALEYFARPGAQDELAAYYRGAATSLDLNAKNKELEALKEKTKANAGAEKKSGQKPRSRVMLYLALAFVALTGVGGALFWMRYGGQAPAVMNQSAGAALDSIATTSKDLTAAASTMVSEMIGAPREPAPSPPTPPPAPPVVAPKTRPRGTREAIKPPVATAGQRAAASSAEVFSPPAVAGGSAEPEPTLPDVDTRVYGPRDVDVKPAELVYKQFPSEYIETVPNAQPGQLDILVLEDGTVGEVRLRPDSNRLQDRMLVAAAKAWRFRPASRAGRPVKYRLLVPITY
jgi:protein TonB